MNHNEQQLIYPREYWSNSSERLIQRFYIGLSLLVSASLDFAVALELKDSKKYNWSSAASYYSMVHAGRLISLLTIGDFPKRHDHLHALLIGRGEYSKININWLKEFSNNTAGIGNKELSNSHTELITQLDSNNYIQDASGTIVSMGKVLESAKKLREDSNYEALIIAHEYNHTKITQEFLKLAQIISNLAGWCLSKAAMVFAGYLQNDIGIAGDRDGLIYFTQKYITDRIITPVNLRQALMRGSIIQSKLSILLSLKVQEGPDIQRRFSELERIVSMPLFGSKSKLMHEFGEKIAILDGLLNTIEN